MHVHKRISFPLQFELENMIKEVCLHLKTTKEIARSLARPPIQEKRRRNQPFFKARNDGKKEVPTRTSRYR